MEVILLERIERLGQMGDIVKVKPGYARNYLLPQAKALRSSKENLALFESRKVRSAGSRQLETQTGSRTGRRKDERLESRHHSPGCRNRTAVRFRYGSRCSRCRPRSRIHH